MTDAQIFRLLGLLYLAAGVGVLRDRGWYQQLIKSLEDSPAAVFLSALLALVVGFLLVAFHNTWGWQWSTLITVFGWLTLARGLFMLAAPAVWTRLLARVRRKPPVFLWGGFLIGLGALFLVLSL